MCGISGIIQFHPDPSLRIRDCLLSMNGTIKHRGPDDEGYVLFSAQNKVHICSGSDTPAQVIGHQANYTPSLPVEKIADDVHMAFGHRRLSILDLTPAGHQPMCNGNSTLWITYNGEIYNYKELRSELKTLGHSFTTNTDVEVLLASYEEWGMECTLHFNGMWAFVMYDLNKNRIWGSRDRTGVKPFYYTLNAEGFSFASEYKALLESPFVKRELNHEAAFDFFVFNTLESEPSGLFKGIYELFPSHSFLLNPSTGDFKTWKYYAPEPVTDLPSFDLQQFNKYSDDIRELTAHAIEIRLRSDVPVGCCLSGGIDSSSIVCTIDELSKHKAFDQIGKKQKVFSSVFKDKRFDESRWAEIVARHIRADWHKTYPDIKGLMHELEELIYCQDIPIRSTSTYAQFKVMKLAALNGVKVLLDGQGADELFAGYLPHQAALWMNQFKRFHFPEMIRQMAHFQHTVSAPAFFKRHFLKYILARQLPAALKRKSFQSHYEELKYIEPGFIHAYKDRFKLQDKVYADSLNRMLHFEYLNHPLKELLKCEDRCSMWFSIESRTPFADDHPLMNYVLSIPETYKIRNGESKSLLRSAMKGILPDQIRKREDKMGFLTPNNIWMHQLKDHIIPYFEMDKSGILNTKRIIKDMDKLFKHTDEPENYRLFKFISFSVWMHVFDIS